MPAGGIINKLAGYANHLCPAGPTRLARCVMPGPDARRPVPADANINHRGERVYM